MQVDSGLLTDAYGCPAAASVFAGNAGDPQTWMAQVEKLRGGFALQSVVLVGDRRMISHKQIEALRDACGVERISARESGAIGKLVDSGGIQMGLFDERNLFETAHEDFPGERLVVRRTPELAAKRAHKRRELLAATTGELEVVARMVAGARLKHAGKIGVRVGRVPNKYKMASHFVLDIAHEHFAYRLDEQAVAEEAVLDGLYVIRTSLSAEQLAPEHAVRHYKALAHVEGACRALKSEDLQIRPIRHRTEDRVRVHLLLCMLAYYVKWHLQEAWRGLSFADEEQARKAARDPVAPTRRSHAALRKITAKQFADGSPAHSVRTLMHELATIVRNTCRRRGPAGEVTLFTLDTVPNENQRAAQRAIDALRL